MHAIRSQPLLMWHGKAAALVARVSRWDAESDMGDLPASDDI